jgi:hypothetical protein
MRKKLPMLLLLGLVSATSAIAVSSQAAEGEPRRAVAYINPDTGAATENSSVNPDSECDSPDQRDRQQVSESGGTENNVHVDACLFKKGENFDGMVTFYAGGAGTISACPDPDMGTIMDGAKVAVTHDHDEDGIIDHCHQSGFQEKDMAGDGEYHVRLNNDGEPGFQNVTFCFDPDVDVEAEATDQPEGHGCKDELKRHKSKIRINWVPSR